MLLFICQLSLAENVEYIDLAIQKSQLETVKTLLANKKISKIEKMRLAKKAHIQVIKRKAKIDNNSSTKGMSRIVIGYICTFSSVANVLYGKALLACANLAIGISFYKWGKHAKKQDLNNKTLSKTQKYEEALSIEELLKKESSSDSDKKE